MTITKQCTDRIVTVMPDGQFKLDRVLAVQTDVLLDPALSAATNCLKVSDG